MALNHNDESKLDKILINKTLLELENLSTESLTLKNCEIIYDINGMENIALLTFKEGGYTFVNKEDGQIIMYLPFTNDIPFTNGSSNSKKIFGGPYTYLIKNDKNEIIGVINYESWQTKATIHMTSGEVFGWSFTNSWLSNWSITDFKQKNIFYKSKSGTGVIESTASDEIMLLTGIFIREFYARILIVCLMIFLIPTFTRIAF